MKRCDTKTMKNLSKKAKEKYITIAFVLICYLAVEILLKTGNMSSLMQGLLVPICTYSIVEA